MQVTVEIPDEVIERMTFAGESPERTTLEAIAIQGFRSGRLSAHQTRMLLGFGTRYELDDFLKAHSVSEHAYSLEDLRQDRLTMQLRDEFLGRNP